jgi:hypothetical protein
LLNKLKKETDSQSAQLGSSGDPPKICDRAAKKPEDSTDRACTREKQLLRHFMALSAEPILLVPIAVTTVISKTAPA